MLSAGHHPSAGHPGAAQNPAHAAATAAAKAAIAAKAAAAARAKAPRANIIAATNLQLRYGKEIIIKPSTFCINEGEFVMLSGKSGSGKSTFLRSLYGEFCPDGELLVMGKHISKLSNKELFKLRRHLGIIFQEYRLINELSVEQNIALPLVVAGFSSGQIARHVKVILRYIKLAHKAKSMPLELSGGEQQRVALGRAIIHNPRLIICDEPTGNLDMQSAEIIFELLNAARKSFGATVIIATHHIPPGLRFSYREICIENGFINA